MRLSSADSVLYFWLLPYTLTATLTLDPAEDLRKVLQYRPYLQTLATLLVPGQKFRGRRTSAVE